MGWRREKTTENNTTNFTRISTTKNMFPFYRGNVSGAVDNRSGNSVPYNFVNTVMLHWVAAAFSGWRGSIRYKLMFDKCNHFFSQNHSSRVYISREGVSPPGVASYTRQLSPYGSNSNDGVVSSFVLAGNMLTTGVNGMLYATDSINSTAEFEIPYYSQYRFTPGKLIDYTNATNTGNWSPNWRMEANLLSSGISSVFLHWFTTYVLRGNSTRSIVCTDFKSINKIKLFSVAENGVCIASDLADRRIKYVTP